MMSSFFLRYIKWTEQTFPQGGKESNLHTLLEQAVARFTNVEKYHNDLRYVEIWIKFVCVISQFPSFPITNNVIYFFYMLLIHIYVFRRKTVQNPWKFTGTCKCRESE